MPNPYHFRAKIDRLWQCANSNARGYKKLKALDTLVREMYGPSERAQRNHRMYYATDPYEVARHLLRDLYDQLHPAALLQPQVAAASEAVEAVEAAEAEEEGGSEESEDPL